MSLKKLENLNVEDLSTKETDMDRRDFLKTLAAGSMMVMLPSSVLSSISDATASLTTVDDLTAWMEGNYECYMGEARAFMCLNADGLKKYNLSFDDLPLEVKAWENETTVGAANLIYQTVAFVVEDSNPTRAERRLVQAVKERFENEVQSQTLIWRVKPQFTSEQVTEYGEVWANREQIEDKLLDHFGMPADVEYSFDTDDYRHVTRRYVLNKLRMRLVLPKQLAEDYEDLITVESGRPKRIES